ncbi:MAG: electron transfer flavoprotein subunit alpha/FixB family protein [Acidobacteria bacterium]|nr:electron transfer flavoprotein subunit alpha/FixB family protein [Acidobacteriota bacterium]
MILVFIEVRDGQIKKYNLEILSEGKRRADELGVNLEAVLIGPNLEGQAEDLFTYGAKKVHLLEHPQLSSYSPSAYTAALLQLLEEVKPAVVLFPASSMGKDLAPRVAAGAGVGVASDCIRTSVEEGQLEVVRPIYAGKALAAFRFNSSPAVATLRPNVFPAMEPSDQKGEISKKELSIPEDRFGDRVDEYLKGEGAELDVTEADIIVSGGRGMKGPENFALLKELAAILPHAAVGASRAAVDSEWIGHQHQVGQTGKTVSPNLYMAFGISGAIQHVAGMSSSNVIVAVNKDSEAPILKMADFGVVGDLFQVIPPLKEELKRLLSE